MPTSGLYYPFIHFKDDDWLKLQALYWSSMARIVPPGYASGEIGEAVIEGDSEVTRQLATELDFVVNVSPVEATYPVSLLFESLLRRHSDALRKRYGVANLEDWPVDRITAAYAQLRDPRLAYVNSTKLDESLVQSLESEGLAHGHHEGPQVWAGMHPKLAAVYMSALAEESATVNGFHPTTDETLDHVAVGGWTLARLAAVLLEEPEMGRDADLGDLGGDGPEPVDPEVPATLAFMSIRAVIPKDPKALTADKVVRVRRSLGGELAAFHNFVQEAAAHFPKLGEGADPSAVGAHLKKLHDEQVQPVLDDLAGALRSQGVDTALAAMGTSVAAPPALAAIDVPEVFGLIGALSFLPVIRAQRRQGKEAYRNSPAAYLYSLQAELEPRTLVGWMRAEIRRFLAGA